MTQASLSPIAAARKPREGTIIATYGDRIAGAHIDCRDIDLAVRQGEQILANAPPGATAANLVWTLLLNGGAKHFVGGLLAVLVARKLGKLGLRELRAGREVSFVFGPEEGRLRAFTSPSVH